MPGVENCWKLQNNTHANSDYNVSVLAYDDDDGDACLRRKKMNEILLGNLTFLTQWRILLLFADVCLQMEYRIVHVHGLAQNGDDVCKSLNV